MTTIVIREARTQSPSERAPATLFQSHGIISAFQVNLD
ncbi:hypothetical protein MEBOL_007145 [Melittangium boletus DSM 14713]|uniref:Uncharacterized protein n=1 Tax=Melittangium boletus DSM 14713 TaxID=1294270 RepID=A0A250IR37_9BACT|nr:hypothetical protein MEBOL_007145 [Melittangium boletus DSM 14713]